MKMALSWKFLQDAEEKNIRTNEVEIDEWKKEAKREEKKGQRKPKKGYCENGMTRKKANIKKQMKVLVKEAKEYWMEAKEAFQARRRALIGAASDVTEENNIRRRIEGIRKKCEKYFEQERKKHKRENKTP